MLYPGINSKFPGRLMIKAIAMIRKLDKTEYDRATSLALEVYIQCGAEDSDEIYDKQLQRIIPGNH